MTDHWIDPGEDEVAYHDLTAADVIGLLSFWLLWLLIATVALVFL